MPYVYHTVDGEQKTNWVDEKDLSLALQQGLVDAKVNLADKHGTIFSSAFDAETINQARQEGLRFESPEEYAFEQERREFGDSPLDVAKAGAAAGLRGATFGISDVALTELGISTPEELAAYQRQNPGIDLAGEITGGVLPALVTGGASLTATGASAAKTGLKRGVGQALRMTPAGQAAKVALKTEAAITKALGGSKLAKAVGSGVAYGAEGGAYGMGHAVSESTLHDRELISEATLADIGMGSLLGAGTVVGLQQVGQGVSGIVGRAKKLLPEIKPGEPGFLDKIIARGDKSNARLINELRTNPESRAILKDHDDFIAGLANDWKPAQVDDFVANRQTQLIQEGIPERQARAAAMAESQLEAQPLFRLKEITGLANKKVSRHHLELKLEHAREMVPSGNEASAQTRASQFLDSYDASIQKMIDGGQGQFEQAMVKKAQARGQQIRKEIEAIAEAGGQHHNADIWYKIDTLKKDLGQYSKRSLALQKNKDYTGRARTEVFMNTFEDARQFLEHADNGAMAVSVQKPVNHAFHRNFNQIEAQIKLPLFRKGPGGEGWIPAEWLTDPKGFAQLIEQLGTPQGMRNAEFFKGLIASERDLTAAIKKSYNLAGKELDEANKAIAAADVMERKIAQAERGFDLARGMQSMNKKLAFDVPTAMRLGGPATAGFVAAGPVGAVAGGAIGAIANPTRMLSVLHALDGKAGQALKSMGQSVKKFIGRKRGTIKPALSMAGAIAGLSASEKAEIESDPQAGFRKIKEQLISLQDPAMLERRVKTTGLYLSPDMQQTMAKQSKRMVDHLLKHAPPAARQGRIDMLQGKPSAYDRRKIKTWFDRLAVASSPIETTMKALGDGTLTGEMVDTLKELYPKTYDELVVKVTQELADPKKNIEYDDKVQLSLLLGVPMDPTMEPAFIGRMQGMYRKQPGQLEPGGEPMNAGKRINTGNLMQAEPGKAVITGPQRLEAKR